MKTGQNYNKATPSRPEGPRLIDGPLVPIDIKAYVEQLKSEKAWHLNTHNAITVFKTEQISIVLVAMHKNADLLAQSTDGILSLLLLEGSITFKTEKEEHSLENGNMIAVHERIPYDIIANEESILILTVVLT